MKHDNTHSALTLRPRNLRWWSALGFAATATLLVLFMPGKSYAAGTPAGTLIITQATASYRDATHSNPQVAGSNIVNVAVAQIAAVNLTPAIASQTARVNSSVDYPFMVVNSGNGSDNLSIAIATSLHLPVDVYVDADRNGVLTLVESASDGVTSTGLLDADSAAYLIARVSIPNDVTLNGQSDMLSVTAFSGFNPTSSATGLYTTTFSSALLSATKSVDVTTPRAGDRVTYTVTCTNSGFAEAGNVRMTDILDGNLRFVTGSATPAPASISGQTIVWDLGTVPGKSSRTLTFTVDVVNNVPPTTEIHNAALVEYNDGTTALQIRSVELNFVIVRSGGLVTLEVSPDQHATGEPSDTVQYSFVITNNGVQPETFNLACSSSRTLGWTLYHDQNENNKVDPGEPVVTTTGPVPGGGAHFQVIAFTRLPIVPTDMTVDVATLRVSSTVNPDNFITRLGSTTIVLPVPALTKEVHAISPVTGGEITYTISYANSGHGSAYQFVLIDLIPVHTAYIGGSTRHNGSAKSDAEDSDEVSVVNGRISATIGTLRPGVSGSIEFKVRIQ